VPFGRAGRDSAGGISNPVAHQAGSTAPDCTG
jgi:hypothetical protein